MSDHYNSGTYLHTPRYLEIRRKLIAGQITEAEQTEAIQAEDLWWEDQLKKMEADGMTKQAYFLRRRRDSFKK